MSVAEAVGQTLARLGVGHAFGVVGSGNFHVTNALVAGGVRYVAARHESGATTMADAYARVSGGPAVVSVHQGCGLTNAMTGIAEAAKSRTPLLVLAAEADSPTSNFAVDQAALAEAVGASVFRLGSAETAVADTVAAWRMAWEQRRTVLLNLPLAVQGAAAAEVRPQVGPVGTLVDDDPDPEVLARLAELVRSAQRPVFIAGRGARLAHARDELVALADASGALLATSAVVKGFFHGQDWDLDISGGFSTPLAAQLIGSADLIVAWGCALTMWTTRHGRLIDSGATVVQVDSDRAALGRQRPVDLEVRGDVRAVASQIARRLAGHAAVGYRTDAVASRLRRERRWRDVPYDDTSTDERIDPRTLTIGLDDLLPAQRILAVDSGNFMGYPAMFLDVPDDDGFCFTQSFQSIGLGLSTAIGAALARPDRLPVAALGDGGALMSICELDTVVRLGLPMAVLAYNDAAYGAEVHHFGPDGHPLDTVQFPDTDLAAIGRGFGCAAVTVRRVADLTAVRDWLSGPREQPLLIDAKVITDQPAWWLAEAFRGH